MTASDYFAAEQLYKAGLANINAEIQQVSDELSQVKHNRNPNIQLLVSIEAKLKDLTDERSIILTKYTNLQNDIKNKLKSGF